MANRLTDTEKWNKSWYCGLTPTHKLFWNFLCDNCNIAGIWSVNWPLVKFHIWEENLDPEILGDHVKVLESGKWFIRGFIEFQQKINSLAELNPNNKAHLGIIRILVKEGILDQDPNLKAKGASKGLLSPPGIGIGTGIGTGKKTTTEIKFKSPVKEVQDFFYAEYQRTFGDKYVAAFAKDGAIFKDLLVIVEKDRIIDLIRVFFQSQDSFIREAGYTIGVFKSQINKLKSPYKPENAQERRKKISANADQILEQYRAGVDRPGNAAVV